MPNLAMIFVWIVGCMLLSDMSTGHVLFRRGEANLQVNVTTMGETNTHEETVGLPFCTSHPRCELKMRTFLKAFQHPDFKILAGSEYLDTICEENYLGDACTGTDVCKGLFFTQHPNPLLFLRTYFCDNRQVLESSMDCWENNALVKAVDHCYKNIRYVSCMAFDFMRSCIPEYVATQVPGCGEAQATFIRDLVEVIIDPSEDMCRNIEQFKQHV